MVVCPAGCTYGLTNRNCIEGGYTWTRGPLNSKSSTCTEGVAVDAAGLCLSLDVKGRFCIKSIGIGVYIKNWGTLGIVGIYFLGF